VNLEGFEPTPRQTKVRRTIELLDLFRMSESSDNKLKPDDLDYEQAKLAYSIIENLIEHTRVVSDLIAMMAQVLDEDTTRALTLTPTWTAYLDSRRSMEKTRRDVEKFAEVLKQLKPQEGNDEG
jgi:hypothetical protein